MLNSLSALVQTKLEQSPFCKHMFVFRDDVRSDQSFIVRRDVVFFREATGTSLHVAAAAAYVSLTYAVIDAIKALATPAL